MNYFELFEIKPVYAINNDDLDLKYLLLQKKYHPDNAQSVDDQLKAVETTILINDAYDVLSNKSKLIEYYLDQKGIKLTDKEVQSYLSNDELMFLLDIQEQFLDNPTLINTYKDEIRAKIYSSLEALKLEIDNNDELKIKQNLAKVMFFSKSLKHMG